MIYQSEKQLQNELRSLVYLAISTRRSLIIPNVLGRDKMDTVNLFENRLALWPGFRVLYIKRAEEQYKNKKLWGMTTSATSIAYKMSLDISVLEPAYYWRIERDYSTDIPKPHIVSLNSNSVHEIEQNLLSPDIHSLPRIVLNIQTIGSKKKQQQQQQQGQQQQHQQDIQQELENWADHSVSSFESYAIASKHYAAISGLNTGVFRYNVLNASLANAIIERVRPCARIFNRIYGNRSCFDKCH